MADEYTPYQKAINRLVADQGSAAFAAVRDAIQERQKELDAALLAELDKETLDPVRLQAMKKGTVELAKLLRDINHASAAFAEQPAPAAPGTETKEVPSGPGY